VLAANSRLIQQAACKAGLGVAILPCVAADREPELIRLLPSEQVASTKLWLVVHRDLAHTARVRAVIDFLADIAPSAIRTAETRGGALSSKSGFHACGTLLRYGLLASTTL
jgi:DNA-binding transcriptional LysR family regulator